MEHQNSQIFCTNSQDSLMGLVCHYQFENGSSQFLFLDVDKDEKIGAFLKHSLSFFVENFVQTIASSNGLILLSSYSEDQSCYYVFNLLTKRSIMILQPCIQGHAIRVGLASNDNYQFEIVIIEVDSSKFNGLKFHIFSSHTNKWKVHHHINLSLPSLPQFEFKELSTPPLYSNCAIHWEIGGYLLVYKVQENNCELIELPNFFEDWSWQSTMTYRRCLCESSECVYYCYIDLDGFHIWELLKENDDNLGSFFDSKKFRWRLVHSVMHENFVSKHQNFYDTLFECEPYKIAPIAYSEQAQTIYLQFPGVVVAYNFDTGNMGSICRYSYEGMNFNCCSFLTSIASGIHNVHKGREFVTNGKIMELNLPIEEIEKLSL